MKTIHFLLTALFALNFVYIKAQCNASGSHYTASYPAGWTFTQIGGGGNSPSTDCGDNNQGNIYGSGTAATFFTARGGREMRLSRDIPMLSNQNWTMDFTLHIQAPAAAGLLKNNSPAVVLASVSSEQGPIKSGCVSAPGDDICVSCVDYNPYTAYPFTAMDAMWVSLTSTPASGCQEDQTDKNWQIVAYARDNGSWSSSSTPISIPSGVNADYYIRLERTSPTTATISVCSTPNYSTHLSGSPQCFTIPQDVLDLDALNHEVHAEGYCYRVFNGSVDHLKIDNNLSCSLQALTPSFVAPSSVCQGQPITLNAAANAGLPISSHNWALQECDATGNVTGSLWWSMPITGQPAPSYTIPASTPGVTITCGKHYKVFLFVRNCGADVITSKIIYINCMPVIQTSPPITICQGQSTTLSVSYKGSTNYTVVWKSISPTEQTLYNGPVSNSSINVTPSVTTNYQVTMTDNVTGCSSTASVTVTVSSINPIFAITNTTNPGYYTISATPVDLNGYNTPSGFQYGWTIEELNGLGNPYYGISSISGTTCWWNYPTSETFLGFVSTGTGTYTQSPGPACGSVPGKFLYNHTYRITRLVLNNFCTPKQYSTIITTTKSGQVITYEDKNAPDMTDQFGEAKAETDNITIFPNPSTGIFTIEFEEGADASSIEVTNSLGQKVKSFEVKGERSELNLKGYTKGIYIVTITSKGSTSTKKIILE